MLNPKKTIPKLAVAALPLTGCGGDDAPGGAEFTASLEAFCANAAPCIATTPAEEEELRAGCINYYNDLNSYNNDTQCTTALISYFDCSATQTCDEFLYGDLCDAQYNAASYACEEVP